MGEPKEEQKIEEVKEEEEVEVKEGVEEKPIKINFFKTATILLLIIITILLAVRTNTNGGSDSVVLTADIHQMKEDISAMKNNQDYFYKFQKYQIEQYLVQKGVTLEQLLNTPIQPTPEIETQPQQAQVPTGNGTVDIKEFSDFLCPYCQQADGTIAQLIVLYGDKINMQFKEFPVHGDPAIRLSEAAKCAEEQGKYYGYREELFKELKQRTDVELEAIATSLSLNKDQFNKCLTDRKYKTAVESDMAEGKTAGVTGTPTFIINGETVVGALPIETFKQKIDAALNK